MKAIKVLLLSLLVTSNVKANYVDSLVKLLNEKNYVEVDRFFHSKDISKKWKFSHLLLLNREIVGAFDEVKIETQEFTATNTPNVSKVKTYIIKLIVKDKAIIYCELIDYSNDKSPLQVLKFKSPKPLQILENDFRSVFGKKFNLKHLFIGSGDDYVYGSNCGYAAMTPLYRQKLNAVIENSDTTILKQWISSTITELQVYGVEGFYMLKQKGIKPSISDLRKINAIKKKRGYLNFCSGCTFFKITITEATKDFIF